MAANPNLFDPKKFEHLFPGNMPGIEKLGHHIMDLATQKPLKDTSEFIRVGRYRREFDSFTVMIEAAVFDSAVASGPIYDETPRFELMLQAHLLAEMGDRDHLTARYPHAHNLESISIQGQPFEGLVAEEVVAFEHWQPAPNAARAVDYVLGGDSVKKHKLTIPQQRLAIMSLIDAFTYKYDIYSLNAKDYEMGPDWPDTPYQEDDSEWATLSRFPDPEFDDADADEYPKREDDEAPAFDYDPDERDYLRE